MDLLGEDLAERAAEDGEVLREHEHLAAVDGAPAGDDAVGVRPLLEPGGVGAVAGEQVELVERAVVEQVLDALPGEQLALGVLALDGARRTGLVGLLPALLEVVDLVLHRRCRSRRATLLPGRRAPQGTNPVALFPAAGNDGAGGWDGNAQIVGVGQRSRRRSRRASRPGPRRVRGGRRRAARRSGRRG